MDEELLNLLNDEVFDVEEEKQILYVKQKALRKRGRGFELNSIVSKTSRENSRSRKNSDRISSVTGDYTDEDEFSPQRSVEGWILFVTNIHEEAEEEDVMEVFSNYGTIKNIHLNLDRRTGYVKGYALVEFETYVEASAAKEAINDKQILGETVKVDWAFRKKPLRVQTYVNRHRKRKS